jgi:hypothetical protein
MADWFGVEALTVEDRHAELGRIGRGQLRRGTSFFSAMNSASGLRSRGGQLPSPRRAAASSRAPSMTSRRAMPVMPTKLAVATVAIFETPPNLLPKIPQTLHHTTDVRRYSGLAVLA